MNSKSKRWVQQWAVLSVWVVTVLLARGQAAKPGLVAQDYQPGDFKLVYDGQPADICSDPADGKVVAVAAGDFADDVARVTGKKPSLKSSPVGLSAQAVLIGTLGRSALIDSLVKDGKLDARELAGQWETFLIAMVDHPYPGVEQGLVICGSDRRGTAFGVYHLSECIGVSPWYWWADVTPTKKAALVVKAGRYREGPPGVKYRGIFINDEMWGIRPWAANTFAPEEGMGLGPKTYRKVFELLLRLKANCCWPAMHGGTKPFNFYPLNKAVADEYAIVMGTSHMEPLLRNPQVGSEWEVEGTGPWDYQVNRPTILQFWEDRLRTNGKFENLYTLGMRGQNDNAMKGGNTAADKRKLLEEVIADQRVLLQKYVNPDLRTVPQVLTAYTEVLGLYKQGLRVPDDVILCFPDDDFGYLRYLPTPREQTRPGGAGIYYHIQWLNGATTAYNWLNTTPPALIWEEMNRAYAYQARNLWMLNVGDIKPGEIGLEFFLRLAWAPETWNSRNLHDYLVGWAARDFGEPFAGNIADLMTDYYRLGLGRRPEHLAQGQGKGPLRTSWFDLFHYGDEAQQRLETYERITRSAEAIYQALPFDRKDAFFELVLYPVKAASLMNQKIIYADKSVRYGEQQRASAGDYAVRARRAAEQISLLTREFNRDLSMVEDKWDRMMALPGPWGAQVRQFEMPPVSDFKGAGPAKLGITVEDLLEHDLPGFNVFTQERHFVDLYNTGTGTLHWQAPPTSAWIVLSEQEGDLEKEKRLWVSVDWDKAPQGEDVRGSIAFRSGDTVKELTVKLLNPASPRPQSLHGFVENNGYVAIEAEHFTRKARGGGGGEWEVIGGLGRTGDAVAVYPVTFPSRTEEGDIRTNSPRLEYDLYLFNPGRVAISVHALPTSAVNGEHGLRVALALDDEPLQMVSPKSRDILSNVMDFRMQTEIKTRGAHTLKIWSIDPGVVLDKIILDLGSLKPTYFGPPETRVIGFK